jgi:protein-S-isoprenylcysteine O-methyltransferase Ste14
MSASGSGPEPEPTPGRDGGWTRGRVYADRADLVARVLTGGLFAAFAWRIAADFQATGRLTGILLLTSELLVVILTITRRPAARVDRSWDARFVTTVSLLGPPLLDPAAMGVSDSLTAPFSAAGLLIVVAAKVALGRSFGLMPAHRGVVVSTGPYRWVRHPIYFGYLITHAAFLASHPTAWNFMVLLVADAALVVRAAYEERTLLADPVYGQYCGRVRWRILPAVY